MFYSIDDPDFTTPINHLTIENQDRICNLISGFFTNNGINYEITTSSSYPDGSLFVTTMYIESAIKYEIAFSNFGCLFTIRSFDSEVSVWKSDITIQLLALFSINGFLYIDYEYANAVLYDGKHNEYKKFTIYERYFSDYYPLEKLKPEDGVNPWYIGA